MATLIAEYRATIISLILLILFFLWMDVSLYYKIQSMKPVIKTTGTTITETTTSHSVLFSPFKGLSVKMAMMDQVNNYIFTPMAEVFNEVTNFSKTFYFVTPNMISFIGIIFAVIAAKFVCYDSLAMHRISVVLFQFRTFFDALDGIVARDHLGIKKHVSLHNTSGYVVDAIADTIGFSIYLLACYIYLRRNLPKQRYNDYPQYLPLQVYDTNGDKMPSLNSTTATSFIISQYIPPKLVRTSKQIFFVVMCFAIQLALSAFFWNRYIEIYHQLLEKTPISPSNAKLQNEVLHSSIMWVLMWFWKLSNAHSLMQMLLVSVFVNRIWEFLKWIQYIGIAEILILAFFTEIHIKDVESYLNRLG